MTQNFDLKQALKKAQETGELFLASLTKEQLQKLGFDASVFGEFKFAEVYLMWSGEEFFLKYLLDGDVKQYYIERPKDLGGEEYLHEVVDMYLRQNTVLEEPGHATILMVKIHPFGPNGGAVYVYQVAPQPTDYMRIQSFYLATFDDQNTEVPWGMGFTPKEAIEDAERKWAKYEEEENPFKKILEEVYN